MPLDGHREGPHARVPEAGQAVPPRRQSRRRRGRGALQGGVGGQRRAVGPREAQGVRPGPRDGGPGRGPGRTRGFGGGFPGGFGAGGQTVQLRGPRRVRRHPRQPVRPGRCGRRWSRSAWSSRARRARRAGADLEAELHLDFLDAVHGITTSVHFTAEAVCSRVSRQRREARHRAGDVPDVRRHRRRARRPGSVLVLAGVPAVRWARPDRQGQVQATARAAASRCVRAK